MSAEADANSRNERAPGALFVGGLAAILASTCCLGPLILVALGLSGAWIGNLTRLEPYRPLFLIVALLCLFFAGWRIFRPAEACAPDTLCAVPRTRLLYRVLFVTVAVLFLIAVLFPYVVKLFY